VRDRAQAVRPHHDRELRRRRGRYTDAAMDQAYRAVDELIAAKAT
jgi:hypothetical protein